MKDLVHNALDGINQTVFAYGQTSSGKTFTMRGSPEKNQLGLIPLSIKEIFDSIAMDTTRDYKVSVSYMEVSIPNIHMKFLILTTTFLFWIDLQRVCQRFD